ncbi:glycosyltransferase [Mycobacterium sp.]|uniref:glycosyltransferase n=1 Tax=Mycobacterium sp. TaxID=1785 RepID=UPI002C467030|nr:glycosyltransferase [Mycobacterium sp.]HTQ21891.1 glycosyltransferase [Mycobacterium sp.]
MFAIGVCVGSQDKFDQWAQRGIDLIGEPDTKVIALSGQPSIFVGYNRILSEARTLEGLEGLILIHEDVYIRDPDCLATLRNTFAEPDVGVVGVYGCVSPKSLAWHSQDDTRGAVEDARWMLVASNEPEDVTVLDGLFLALSPAAVAALDFDESRFDGWHGYDADICLQARKRRMRVRVEPIDVYHATKGTYGSRTSFVRTDLLFRAKWGDSGLLNPAARTWTVRPKVIGVALACAPVTAWIASRRSAIGRWRRSYEVKNRQR